MLKIPRKKLYICRALRYIGMTIGGVVLLFIFLFSTWKTVDLSQAFLALGLLLIVRVNVMEILRDKA